MTGTTLLFVVLIYFVLLVFVARLTSGKKGNYAFFKGEQKSPWYLVAFGMIGASLSGITFVSVTGQVNSSSFGYMQMVIGYLIGYGVIAYVLLPIYYRYQVVSIYEYLGNRLGKPSYYIGTAYFMLSRVFGASIRLLLVAQILHRFVLVDFGVPFWATVVFSVLLIWLYTFRGGIKTIVWTDTLQTMLMLIAAITTFVIIAKELNFSIVELTNQIFVDSRSKIFFLEGFKAGNFWIKQILAGAAVALCMTGLDQDMMQKNLTCKDLRSSQKNVVSFSIVQLFVNLFFLMLGCALLMYAEQHGIKLPLNDAGKIIPDAVYPSLALENGPLLGGGVAILFIVGLVAAAYSSADSALASLTTCFCVDILGYSEKTNESNSSQLNQIKSRQIVHVLVSLVLILVALVLNEVLEKNALMSIFKLAALTYGPLLGLFSFGILTKAVVLGWKVLPICLVGPVLCFLLGKYDQDILNGYQFSHELLLINGLITFVLLWTFSDKRSTNQI